jgi:hypothetical protein
MVISIKKGVRETVTIEMRPPENIDGWLLEFRAKSNATNPNTKLETYLSEDIDADDDTIIVSTARDWPLYGPFKVRIDDEVMQVTTGVGYWSNGTINQEWVVERGVWGTPAVAHTKRARITLFQTPQMLLDNGTHGGVSVEDADVGIIELVFDASLTAERPVGAYFWNLKRTDAGAERVIAEGVMYLLPTATSAFDEPPLHNL